MVIIKCILLIHTLLFDLVFFILVLILIWHLTYGKNASCIKAEEQHTFNCCWVAVGIFTQSFRELHASFFTKSHINEQKQPPQSILEAVQLGSVLRSRSDRVCGLQSDGRVVACHGKGPTVDLFAVLTEEEVAAKTAKRARKERKRARWGREVTYGN